jgi:hypothetical protein
MIALAALLPHVQIGALVHSDASAGLEQSAGLADRLALGDALRADFRCWLSWDLAKIVDDDSVRAESSLRRERARRRTDRVLARTLFADRARSALARARAATTTVEAALALLDRDEALASRPEAP